MHLLVLYEDYQDARSLEHKISNVYCKLDSHLILLQNFTISTMLLLIGSFEYEQITCVELKINVINFRSDNQVTPDMQS
jgi:hypothetical protein